MNLEDLPEDIQFCFIAVMQSAIFFKKNERDEKEFLKFCKGIWESMELAGLEKTQEIIAGKMEKDIQTHFEKSHK